MSTAKRSLGDYLASKYLEKDETSKKRKSKSKSKTTSSNLIIADDDLPGWSTTAPIDSTPRDSDSTILSTSSGFKKSKTNAWKTVGTPALQPRDDEDAAADRIIAAAAQESTAGLNQDEEPAMDTSAIEMMGDGTHAGLQKASDISKQVALRQEEELREFEAEQRARAHKASGIDAGEETVYRDATGRRINISDRRKEAAREASEKAAKAAAELEAQKGDVQLAARQKRREDLDEARFMPVARKIDDEDMNREMKEQDRWNDPAAQFLTRKKEGRSASGRKVYQGAAAPNRYGIRPGAAWDGVDRGNGHEAERFKAMNRRTRNKELDFAWQTDT